MIDPNLDIITSIQHILSANLEEDSKAMLLDKLVSAEPNSEANTALTDDIQT